MSGREERLAALVARGLEERRALALETALAREEIDRRRAQWKAASLIATGIAAAGTVAYKLFGKASLARRLSSTASAVSLAVGLIRAFRSFRRFS
jgi:hypothetical protein